MRERPKGSGNWLWEMRRGIDPITGEPRRISRTFEAKTRAAAEKKVRGFIAELEDDPETGSNVTMSYLFARWIEQLEVTGKSPSTVYAAKRQVARVIEPALGKIPVDKLQALDLDRFYAAQLKGPNAVSPATIRRYHAAISAALSQAKKWKMVKENVARDASPPRVPRSKLVVPSVQEIAKIIEVLSGFGIHYAAAAMLAAGTGLRRGEICALQWRSIHDGYALIEQSAIRLEGVTTIKSTKNERERLVPLAGATKQLLIDWRANREALAQEFEVTIPDTGFIFSPMPDQSKSLNPDTLTSMFSKAARAAGCPHVHFHSLRHYAATELIGGGVDVRNAAAVLGHANVRMTLEVYAHETADRQTHAAEVLGRAMPAVSFEIEQ